MPRGHYDRSKAKKRKAKPTAHERAVKWARRTKRKATRPITSRLRAGADTPPHVRAQLDRNFARARGYDVRTTKFIVVHHPKQEVILANDEVWILKSMDDDKAFTVVRVEIDNLSDLYVHDTDGKRTHLLFNPGENGGFFYEEQEPLNAWEFVGRVDLPKLEVVEVHDDFKDKVRGLA